MESGAVMLVWLSNCPYEKLLPVSTRYLSRAVQFKSVLMFTVFCRLISHAT
jgi:hypothetical protein